MKLGDYQVDLVADLEKLLGDDEFAQIVDELDELRTAIDVFTANGTELALCVLSLQFCALTLDLIFYPCVRGFNKPGTEFASCVRAFPLKKFLCSTYPITSHSSHKVFSMLSIF